MIKVLFLINTLGAGGAERVLVNLVNHMDRDKFDITVETMFDDGVNASFLDPGIRLISRKAPCPRGIAYIFRLLSPSALYRYFIGDERYDILVAFMHGAPVKVIDGCPHSGVKKILWLHNGNPATGSFFRFWLSEKRAFEAYRSFDALAAVSDSVANAFSSYTGIENVSTVYNTNDTAAIRKMADEFNPYQKTDGKTYIVSVGRISEEKGTDRLYSVCKKLNDNNIPVDVTVAGDGDKAGEIRELSEKDGSGGWFHMAGFQKNPYPYIKNADLFVCPSYQEGLSTATTEAVILGVPVVSTDVSGAREILGENGEYGIVTDNNEDSLYEGILRMVSGDGLIDYYREMSLKRAEDFSTEKTVSQAQNLFFSVLND